MEAITDMGITPPGVSSVTNKLTKFPAIRASTENRKKKFKIVKYQTQNIESTLDESSPAVPLRPKMDKVFDDNT